MELDPSPQKRKRSPSPDIPAGPTPSAKSQKTSHVQINYLARQYTDTLPLIHADNDLPTLLHLISEYDGVLHRHESLAGNMGARPLGPILIQRFERLFDGPPRVLKSHAKDGAGLGWLDVVDFARNKPEQFNLDRQRDGMPVCQFYTKQCRVEISEDDYLLISSGMPQKLIPPQPIVEDEEKELGTLEILEKRLGQVVQAADQVSAKARQLNHRLRWRKHAIVSRREHDNPEAAPTVERPQQARPNGEKVSRSPTGGFVAVNAKPHSNGASRMDGRREASIPAVNGSSAQSASATTREELLRNFSIHSERTSVSVESDRRASGSRDSLPAKTKSRISADQLDYAGFLNAAASPVAIPNTPSSLIPHVKPSASERYDDSGPYKADMMLRMEQLNRGDRVMPPCDRCRRLHMDCLKNLTACIGCTKKHAKCSWKDVEEQELRDHPLIPRVVLEGKDKDSGDESKSTTKSDKKKDYGNESVGVRDEELLGESSDSENEVPPIKPEGRKAQRFEAKSLSPPAAANETDVSRNGVQSAPATKARSPPPSSKSSPPATKSSAPPTAGLRKPDIPIYHPPPADSPVRTFTAHEWDTYTRRSSTAATNTHATPNSDIHDELKSAALEAERRFQHRDSDVERQENRELERKQQREKDRERERERERERRDSDPSVATRAYPSAKFDPQPSRPTSFAAVNQSTEVPTAADFASVSHSATESSLPSSHAVTDAEKRGPNTVKATSAVQPAADLTADRSTPSRAVTPHAHPGDDNSINGSPPSKPQHSVSTPGCRPTPPAEDQPKPAEQVPTPQTEITAQTPYRFHKLTEQALDAKSARDEDPKSYHERKVDYQVQLALLKEQNHFRPQGQSADRDGREGREGEWAGE